MRVVWILILLLGIPIVALSALSMGIEQGNRSGDPIGLTGMFWSLQAIPLWIGLAIVFMVVGRNYSAAVKRNKENQARIETKS